MRSTAARSVAIVLLLGLGSSASAQSLCGPNGLTLSLGATTLGDPSNLVIGGSPFISGLLGLDVAGGPVPTPFGPVCLGLTPQLQLLPFALDAQGLFAIYTVVPPDPALAGVGRFLQAAADDPAQPGGIALSNGLHAVLRAPRLWVFGEPNQFCVYDTLNDVVSAPMTLPAAMSDAVPVPALDGIAAIVNDPPYSNPQLVFVDGSGSVVASAPLPAIPRPVGLAVDGTTVYVVSAWTSQGSVQAFSVPSATPGITVALPFSPDKRIIAPPALGMVFTRTGSSAIVPVDMIGGAVLPTISLGLPLTPTVGLLDWMFQNGKLYCLASGAGIYGIGTPASMNAIDVATLTPMLPAAVPLPIAGTVSGLEYGTDLVGTGFLVSVGGLLLHIDPATLTAANIFAFGIVNGRAAITAGGSEYLMFCGSLCGPQYQRFDLMTAVVSSISPPATPPGTLLTLPASDLLPVPSTFIRKAYFVMRLAAIAGAAASTDVVVRVATDYSTGPFASVPLPFTSQHILAFMQ